MPADLRRIARDALCLSESPYLKHYRRGRFRLWNGVGFSGSELPGPGFNFAAAVNPDAPPLDAIVAAGREFFADAAAGWGVLVEGDTSHPVEAELLARGWAVAEDEPAYVLPELPPAVPPPAGLTVRPVASEADRRTFGDVCTAAYGAPPDLADMIMPSLAFAQDPDMWWLIAERGGEPVGVGGGYRVGPAVVVAGLATPERHRGAGVGAAVVYATLARAAAAGCTVGVLRSGPLSRPLYERLGFRYAGQHRTYAVPG